MPATTRGSRSSPADPSVRRRCCASTCCTVWPFRSPRDSSWPFTSGACAKTEGSRGRYDLPEGLHQRTFRIVDLVSTAVFSFWLHRLLQPARRPSEIEGGLRL